MDTLEECLWRLNLTKVEDSKIRIDEDKLMEWNKRGEFSLVGRMLVEWIINKEIIWNTMKKIWRT